MTGDGTDGNDSGTEMPRFRWIDASGAAEFAVRVLLDLGRRRPIVAITTHSQVDEPPIPPERLARELGSRAEVVLLRTGDATWALSEAMPARLDVFGGAARIWWPGLTTTSDPHDHPLLFVYNKDDAHLVEQRIIAAIRDGDARAGRFGVWRPPMFNPDFAARGASNRGFPAVSERRLERPGARAPNPLLDATVMRIEGSRIHVDADGVSGIVVDADVPLDRLAADLTQGVSLRVRRVDPGVTAAAAETAPIGFSTRGLRPDPWGRISAAYHVGDVVRGRVCTVKDRYVLVELLPSAALIVPLGEIDWSFVRHPSEILQVGERVKIKILDIDPSRHKGTASIKQAYVGDPRPPLSPGPGQPPFLDDAEVSNDRGEDEDTDANRMNELQKELDSTVTDRAALMERLRRANDQIAAMRKDARSAEDRLRGLERRASGGLDPTTSATAFLTAVRIDYARRFNESDRRNYPLQQMVVGHEFLTRVRDLDGIAVQKVVEVCVQVASRRAHEIAGREVHELHAGEGGAPTRLRTSDGAKAWRCSLHDNTASARRLHWWEIPGRDGRTIEFASVAVHDDFSIP